LPEGCTAIASINYHQPSIIKNLHKATHGQGEADPSATSRVANPASRSDSRLGGLEVPALAARVLIAARVGALVITALVHPGIDDPTPLSLLLRPGGAGPKRASGRVGL